MGEKLTARSGILELMDDLGRAMTIEPDMLMLGGGNPAAVPAVLQMLRDQMRALLNEGGRFDRMLVNYDPPQGNPVFRAALAALLKRTYGWDIGPEHVAITTGGQTAFFFLFNMLAGECADGGIRKVLLPLSPEYIGYADQGLRPDLFVSCRPRIVWPQGEAERVFKYEIDFDAVRSALEQHTIAVIAVSRPTNPTGNVVTDAEVQQLAQLAQQFNIPLILDNAYGKPFPGVLFVEGTPYWDPNTILTLSLSKLGLPGTRTGIVVAPEPIATALGAMTAIAGLANGNVGQQLVLPWVESGEILSIGPDHLVPFYREKSLLAQTWTHEAFADTTVDWALHASEGAFFHWLWLRNLSIPTREFYEFLKRRKVLVVPGEYFFFGLSEPWPHSAECLRLNYSQPEDRVRAALAIIAEEAQRFVR
ncbi:MAG: valine--pyruvate transaminase [Planctomycetaceae bacterium]|nr:valine--pyruvate transaminase [Planctomycetaceae bacterium]